MITNHIVNKNTVFPLNTGHPDMGLMPVVQAYNPSGKMVVVDMTVTREGGTLWISPGFLNVLLDTTLTVVVMS